MKFRGNIGILEYGAMALNLFSNYGLKSDITLDLFWGLVGFSVHFGTE